MARKFRYQERDLEDPNPDLSPSEVMYLYAGIYSDLIQGRVDGPVNEDGVETYTFTRVAGTKGTDILPEINFSIVPDNLGVFELAQCIFAGAFADIDDADVPPAPHESLGLV
jgi:PRTRC genetic system protein C